MTYKTFLIGFSIIVSIFILCSSIIYIPIISDIIVNSEKTIQIRILKLISLINIIYHLASVLKLNKLINIILIIIVLSIIEFITLKDYHIKRTKSITQQDKQLGWTWIPNSSKISHINGKEVKVRFNSQGLRGSEESLKNKILFLGNSVTQGQSVQEKETFSYILNGINGGFDGYDTYMQRDRFKRDLHNLQIDKLILVLNTADIYSLKKSKQKINQTLQSNHSIKETNILIDTIFKIKIIDFFSQKQNKKEDIAKKDNWYLKKHKTKVPKQIWNEWTSSILELKQYHKDNFYVVLTVPRSIYKENRKTKHIYWLNQELKLFCIQNNIKFIDTLEHIRYTDSEIYIDYIHFNNKGHKEISRIIKENLVL